VRLSSPKDYGGVSPAAGKVILRFCGKATPLTGLERPAGHLEVETPRISRGSAHLGGKVATATHRPPLTPRDIPESTPGVVHHEKGCG
jgi:hypothetical protein